MTSHVIQDGLHLSTPTENVIEPVNPRPPTRLRLAERRTCAEEYPTGVMRRESHLGGLPVRQLSGPPPKRSEWVEASAATGGQ
jgi:hypothetical protein